MRTLAQEIRGRIDAAGPAVVAVAARADGKASLVVAVNAAARSRGLARGDLVKGALSGRGGGNADLAQGGGVPADQAPNLLAAVEKAVAVRVMTHRAERGRTASVRLTRRSRTQGAAVRMGAPA